MGIFKKETLGKRVRRLNAIPTGVKHLLDFEELWLKKAHICSWELPDDTWQSGMNAVHATCEEGTEQVHRQGHLGGGSKCIAKVTCERGTGRVHRQGHLGGGSECITKVTWEEGVSAFPRSPGRRERVHSQGHL